MQSHQRTELAPGASEPREGDTGSSSSGGGSVMGGDHSLCRAALWRRDTAAVPRPYTQQVPPEISGCQNRALGLERARGAPATADCSRDHRSGKLHFEKVYFVNSFSSQN